MIKPVSRAILFPALSFAMAACGLASSAHSQSFKFKVYSEDDDANLSTCGLSHVTTKASVEAALRYNRMILVNNDDDADLYAYVSVSSLAVKRGYEFTGHCATSYSLMFHNFIGDDQRVLSDNKTRFVKTVYCEKGGLILYDKNEAQTVVSNSVKELVDECVSEIGKKILSE